MQTAKDFQSCSWAISYSVKWNLHFSSDRCRSYCLYRFYNPFANLNLFVCLIESLCIQQYLCNIRMLPDLSGQRLQRLEPCGIVDHVSLVNQSLCAVGACTRQKPNSIESALFLDGAALQASSQQSGRARKCSSYEELSLLPALIGKQRKESHLLVYAKVIIRSMVLIVSAILRTPIFAPYSTKQTFFVPKTIQSHGSTDRD